jgi:hypothetical protein
VSSLPPYNPAPSERRIWLLNSASSNDARAPLLGSLRDVERIDSEDLDALRREVESGKRDVLLIAPETVLVALVLGLVGGRPGMARLRFLPDVLSQVQILPDRAVVRHLNPGVFFR